MALIYCKDENLQDPKQWKKRVELKDTIRAFAVDYNVKYADSRKRREQTPHQWGFDVKTKTERGTYHFCVPTQHEQQCWVQGINNAIAERKTMLGQRGTAILRQSSKRRASCRLSANAGRGSRPPSYLRWGAASQIGPWCRCPWQFV